VVGGVASHDGRVVATARGWGNLVLVALVACAMGAGTRCRKRSG
jgi:hypothetical protein